MQNWLGNTLVLIVGLILFSCNEEQELKTENQEEKTEVKTTLKDTIIVKGFESDPYIDPLPPEMRDTLKVKIDSSNHKKFLSKDGHYDINWDLLSDVYIYSVMLDGAQGYGAKFGKGPLFLENKKVKIEGYVITFPVEPNEGVHGMKYMLSLYPNDGCFFCGGGGPETAMEFIPTEDQRMFIMDEYQKFKGTLVLHPEDPTKMKYELHNAEVLEDEF